jgi:hypothetical protein
VFVGLLAAVHDRLVIVDVFQELVRCQWADKNRIGLEEFLVDFTDD